MRGPTASRTLATVLNACSPTGMASARVDLNLGQKAFLRALEELAKEKADLIKGARVAVKVNARGEVVFAVVVPMSGAV